MAIETQTDAAEAWKIIRTNASNLKQWLTAEHAELASSDVTLESVVAIYRRLRDHRLQLVAMSAVENINAYVQDMRNDQTYDAVAQVTAVTDAINAALSWVDNNASGLTLTGDTASNAIANGSIVTNRFTPAQTSGLRSAMVTIGAAINA